MARRRKTDPCHCGSGRQWRYCHGAPPEPPAAQPPQRRVFVGLLAVLVPVAVVVGLSGVAGSPPPPPDPGSAPSAPSGKVWSEAHGHWHDAEQGSVDDGIPVWDHDHLVNAPFKTEFELKPSGDPPPGMVWSDAHGHWHELP